MSTFSQPLIIRPGLALALFLAFGIRSFAQTADNGLNISGPNNVQLGGSLLKSTTIDQNGFDFHLKNGNYSIFTTLANGNVGIGNSTPAARLSFPDAGKNEEASGMTWSGASYTYQYGIHRTAGPWVSPNYQQLRLGWETGIILDPGVSYGKSYVDIQGNGLRVTQGNVGIGTTMPHSLLEVGASPHDDQSPYTSSIWDSYSARFNNGNVSIFSPGIATTSGYSYQLSFYARYHDGGQGAITSKASYIKGSVTTVRDYDGDPWRGQGALVLGSTNTSYFPPSFTDVPAMYVTNGQVGIGVSTPESQLHTTGTVRFAGLTNDNVKDRVIVSDATGNLAYRDASTLGGGSAVAGWKFGGNNITTEAVSPKLGTIDNTALQIITSGEARMLIDKDGNVGIGTDKTSTYKLSVEGTVRTRKVRVDPGTWADYVFENDYKLRPLKEVEQYIQQEKHLPDVPSAAEVKKDGLDVGDNQVVLLKKIEELTLYVIQQQKELEAQQQKIETLEKKVNEKK